jgi:hypothetical protein
MRSRFVICNLQFNQHEFSATLTWIPSDFVGYWPSQDTVVVAHQGTDPTKLRVVITPYRFSYQDTSNASLFPQSLSLLTDAHILQRPLDPALFPTVPSSVKVHSGFRNAHALTATKILAEVKTLLTTKNTRSVTLVSYLLVS